MDDLISRQALLNSLDSFCSERCSGVCSECGFTGAVEIIKNLPSAQQWIPVSERLPEEKTNVLILADTIAGKMAKVSFLYKDDEGRVCWTGLDVYGLNPCDWQPTHWMPLPEPY